MGKSEVYSFFENYYSERLSILKDFLDKLPSDLAPTFYDFDSDETVLLHWLNDKHSAYFIIFHGYLEDEITEGNVKHYYFVEDFGESKIKTDEEFIERLKISFKGD